MLRGALITSHAFTFNIGNRQGRTVSRVQFDTKYSSIDHTIITRSIGKLLPGKSLAGILPQAQKETDGSNTTPAAAVQGSVAAVIQDITGERPPPTNPSTISTSPLSINSIAQSNDRPQLIHH